MNPLKAATALAFATVMLSSAPAARQDDLAHRLEAARVALGGDALSAVTWFTLTGAVSLAIANSTIPAGTLTFDVKCVLPDRFVRTTHQLGYMSPTDDKGSDVAEFVGFNGSDAIRETVAVFGGAAPNIDPLPKTIEDRAKSRAVEAANGQRMFASFTLPLFAASFAGLPIRFESVSQAKMGDRQLDVINGADVSGQPWRLFLDGNTHLPALVTWMAAPVVQYSDRHGTMLGGPRTSGEFVNWRLELTDYSVANGLSWPHKLRMSYPTTMAPHIEEYKISRVAINPKLDPKVFNPSK